MKDLYPAHAPQIRAGLAALLERLGDNGFVIFSDPDSGAFVQFAGDPDDGLVFDLPFQPLDKEALARARKYLPPRGLKEEGDEMQSMFTGALGPDVERACEAAQATFAKVYRLAPGFSLKVETD